MSEIFGYTYGTSGVARSPVTIEEFERMKEAVPFGDEDVQFLRMAGEVLADQLDEVFDVVVDIIGDKLDEFWGDPSGGPNPKYTDSLYPRLLQWILDTCNRPYDQEWLDYQHEIALRHHRTKKNQTDGVESVPNVPFRYMIPFIWSNTQPIRPLLAKKGHSDGDVEKMLQAWSKSVILQVALWSYPYVKQGDW